MEGIDPEWVDLIPGKLTERRSPLGELHWTFTAIMDAIAWNSLPSALFRKLFRQDLLVASLFRNFLLADRILRQEGKKGEIGIASISVCRGFFSYIVCPHACESRIGIVMNCGYYCG